MSKGLWYLTSLSTIYQLCCGGNQSTQLKPLTCRKSLYHIMLYRVFELTTWVVIGIICIGSCKSNYHTITTMMAPYLFEQIGQHRTRKILKSLLLRKYSTDKSKLYSCDHLHGPLLYIVTFEQKSKNLLRDYILTVYRF